VHAVSHLRSLRAHAALDGVSWVQSGLVETAVGQTAACYRIDAVTCSPPRASLRSGARCDLLFGYAGLNSVLFRSMACIIMAKRRASAIRAFHIVDRLAIANAQSQSFVRRSARADTIVRGRECYADALQAGVKA
jgi:hypothetical protein